MISAANDGVDAQAAFFGRPDGAGGVRPLAIDFYALNHIGLRCAA